MVAYGGKGNKIQKHKIQRITENTFTITTLPIQVQCHSLQYWLIWLLVALSNHDLLSTPPPVGVAEYCDERVCVFPVFVRLFVCMRVYLHDYICPIFTSFRMFPVPWLGPPVPHSCIQKISYSSDQGGNQEHFS